MNNFEFIFENLHIHICFHNCNYEQIYSECKYQFSKKYISNIFEKATEMHQMAYMSYSLMHLALCTKMLTINCGDIFEQILF